MTNELMAINNTAIMPVMNIEQAVSRRQAIIDFTKRIMVPNTDFGAIPGTSKPTLLKPGAEKLTTLFGLSPRFEIVEKELDWTGERHGGEAFFYFQYRCALWRGDILAGEGVGSCNSWEKKYRWRTASRACPNCGKETIIKGKAEYGGGWLCFAKKGGCGAKFGENDPSIVDQEIGQVPNDNPADLVNTLDKMAQKRALVAATLIAVNASEFFTQDVEDMDLSFIDGDYMEVQSVKTQRPPQKPNGRQPAPMPEPANELDAALGTTPPTSSKKATVSTDQQKPSEAQMRQLHSLGEQVYGPDWPEKRHELVSYVTDGRSESSKHLTATEWQRLMDGMSKRLQADPA